MITRNTISNLNMPDALPSEPDGAIRGEVRRLCGVLDQLLAAAAQLEAVAERLIAPVPASPSDGGVKSDNRTDCGDLSASISDASSIANRFSDIAEHFKKL